MYAIIIREWRWRQNVNSHNKIPRECYKEAGLRFTKEISLDFLFFYSQRSIERMLICVMDKRLLDKLVKGKSYTFLDIGRSAIRKCKREGQYQAGLQIIKTSLCGTLLYHVTSFLLGRVFSEV